MADEPEDPLMYQQRAFARSDGDRRHSRHAVRFPLDLPGGERLAADRRQRTDRRQRRAPETIELFRGVPRAVYESVLQDCTVRTFDREIVLLRPGDPNTHIYVLLSGGLRVHLDAPNSGNAMRVAPGACIGELSMIDGKPPSAWVVADAGAQVLTIDQSTFWSRVVTQPQAARNLMGILTERMRTSNDAAVRGLRQQHQLELVQKELSVAREIQESMLPRAFPRLPGGAEIAAAASMVPAREVGGDLYDLFVTADGQVCFVIGDVSDKGLPAALFMARTMDIVRVVTRLLPTGEAPAQRIGRIMQCVNEELCPNNAAAMFVTLLVGMLDPATGRLHLASAGHPPPYRLGIAGGPAAVELPPGVPVGLVSQKSWAVKTITLAPGDVLVAYTDGVTEAADARGELYGEARLEGLLTGLVDRTPRAIVAAIEAGVGAFVGSAPVADDTTLLALRWP